MTLFSSSNSFQIILQKWIAWPLRFRVTKLILKTSLGMYTHKVNEIFCDHVIILSEFRKISAYILYKLLFRVKISSAEPR